MTPKPYKIFLVIEDNSVLRFAMQQMETHLLLLVMAMTLEEGKKEFDRRNGEFDAILVDIHLPERVNGVRDDVPSIIRNKWGPLGFRGTIVVISADTRALKEMEEKGGCANLFLLKGEALTNFLLEEGGQSGPPLV